MSSADIKPSFTASTIYTTATANMTATAAANVSTTAKMTSTADCVTCKEEGQGSTITTIVQNIEHHLHDTKDQCLYRGGVELPQLESREHQDLAKEFDLIVKATQSRGNLDAAAVSGLIKVHVPHGNIDITNALAIAGVSGHPVPNVSNFVASSDNVPSVREDHVADHPVGNFVASSDNVPLVREDHGADHPVGDGEDSKRYPCAFCGKRFSRKDSRKRHERIHTQDRPHKCSYCVKTFISKSHQKAHESTHTGLREFGCSYCDKAFPRSDKRNRHEKIHFRDTSAGPPVPRSNATTRPTPVQHTLPKIDHTVMIREQVDDKVSSSNPSLKYTCRFCPKTFPRVDSRKRHERTHTGQKPHKCSFCEHSFVTAYHKMLHERTHTKEKPYECMICKKEFSRMDSLRRHEKLHQ